MVDVAHLYSEVVALDRPEIAEKVGQVGMRTAAGPPLVAEPVRQAYLVVRVVLHIASHSILVVLVVFAVAGVGWVTVVRRFPLFSLYNYIFLYVGYCLSSLLFFALVLTASRVKHIILNVV